MKSALQTLGVALVAGSALLIGVPAHAASDDNSSSSAGSSSVFGAKSDYEAARDAALAGDYDKAIRMLNDVVGKEPRNADAFNMLGYSNRKKGNYDKAMEYYGTALRIDPDHKGAHEYIGQAYLEQKNLPKAKEHLQRLDRICSWGCEEYDSLKRAVQSFETGGVPSEYGNESSG